MRLRCPAVTIRGLPSETSGRPAALRRGIHGRQFQASEFFRGPFREMPMRKLLALTIGALALPSLAIAVPDHPAWSQAARTIRVVISVPPGGSIDLLVRILADHISSTKGQIDHRREQAGRRRHHRGRSGGARGAGRQHAADQQQRHDHQLDPAQGELRSADELRADLLSGHDAADHRRQQRVALSHAGGAGGRGARQAGRAVDRQRRAQHHPAHRDRTVQAAGPGQFDLRAVSGRRADRECAARRARDRPPC